MVQPSARSCVIRMRSHHGPVLFVLVRGFACALRLRSSESDSAGVKLSASSSDVSSAAVIVIASARKKLPVTPVTAISGRNTTTGVMVEPISGVVISCSAVRTASTRVCPAVAMHDDVLHHHDGVVDDQADGRSQPAQRHQVEALADDPEEQDRHRDRHRDHQARDQR